MKIKLIHAAVYAILVVMIATGLLTILLLVYPYKTAELDVPIKILNKDHQIAPGENIKMELHINKEANIQPDISISITCDDGSLFSIDPIASKNTPVGKHIKIQDTYILPKGAIQGSKCMLNYSNIYKVNPIRSVNKFWSTETFTVK